MLLFFVFGDRKWTISETTDASELIYFCGPAMESPFRSEIVEAETETEKGRDLVRIGVGALCHVVSLDCSFCAGRLKYDEKINVEAHRHRWTRSANSGASSAALKGPRIGRRKKTPRRPHVGLVSRFLPGLVTFLRSFLLSMIRSGLYVVPRLLCPSGPADFVSSFCCSFLLPSSGHLFNF